MDAQDAVRKQLLDLLGGGNAHMDFIEALSNFPPQFLNSQPPNSDYTPWRLLEHMRITQWDILEFIRNPSYVSPEWPQGYWPTAGETADEEKWQETLDRFRKDHRQLLAIAEDPGTDLLSSLPHAPGYNILREVLVLSDHNAYHIGEFALMRQIMNTWTKEHDT